MHRILVVDDDPTIRRLLGIVVGLTHDVVEVDNTSAALRAIDIDGPFDLILVDWMMPGHDGLELIKEIRRDRGRQGAVPIIMLTAKDGAEAEDLAYRAGADAYLTKPFVPEIVESLIDVMIMAASRETGVHRVSRNRPEELAGT